MGPPLESVGRVLYIADTPLIDLLMTISARGIHHLIYRGATDGRPCLAIRSNCSLGLRRQRLDICRCGGTADLPDSQLVRSRNDGNWVTMAREWTLFKRVCRWLLVRLSPILVRNKYRVNASACRRTERIASMHGGAPIEYETPSSAKSHSLFWEVSYIQGLG